MSAIDTLTEKIDSLRKVLEEEKKVTSLDKVLKPSLVDEVLSFDYSYLDSLPLPRLINYMGALSQYLIYINKHINQLTVARDCAENEFKTALSINILYIDKKQFATLEERKAESQKDEVLIELKKITERYDARVAENKNIPESINNLIQTLKKVYDSKVQEGYSRSVAQ